MRCFFDLLVIVCLSDVLNLRGTLSLDEKNDPEATLPGNLKKSKESFTITPEVDNNASLLDSYKETLISFGLRRIRNGRSLEKVFWTVGIFIIITFTCYTLYRNAVRYFSFGVRPEVRTVEKAERALPVITFCLESTFSENFYCYNNKSFDEYIKCQKTGVKTLI